MLLRRHLTRAALRTSGALLGLALPLGLLGQATRLLPLLVAAAPAWRSTGVLVAGALGMLVVALAPPLLGAGVALALVRFEADGALRALAAHGLGTSGVVGLVRPLALGAALLVLLGGVALEPPLAGAMRSAVRDLGARGVAGTLVRGGEIEPVPGLVVAAPHGAPGPLLGAFVREGGAGPSPAVLVARRFRVGAGVAPGVEPGVEIAVSLDDAAVEVDGLRVHARHAVVTAGVPAAPDDVVAPDLGAAITRATPGARRRHAGRILWGVLGYCAILGAAALALAPASRVDRRGRVRGRDSLARRVVLATAVPLGALVAVARVGQRVGGWAQGPWGIYGGVGLVAALALIATEMGVRGVAAGRRRVL